MKVTKFNPVDGLKRSHKKDNHFYQELAVIANLKGNICTPVILRYYGTGAVNYACLWINDNYHSTWCSGSGSAGGYGYNRESAAAAEAIETAGFTLDQNISGVGETAVKEALTAIAAKLGYKKIYIHSAHA